MKKSKAAVILAVILAAFVGLAYYASIILSSTGIGEDMSIPLGLDLSGGVSITYQVVDENPSAEDMSDTIYKLQKRVDSYSTEASVFQVGDDRITVEIPGVQDANQILLDIFSALWQFSVAWATGQRFYRTTRLPETLIGTV